nr:hypothetical protein [Tanacetum cinerariifolium]
MKSLDQADILIQKHSKPERFPKKSGLAKSRTTWFDLFLKSDIDKDENHILGPSTVAIAKKFKELIQKDEFTIADFEGARLERLKVQYNNDVELEYHVSQLKAAVLSEARWNSDEGDFFKTILFERHMSKRMSSVTEGNVFSDLRIKSVVRIDEFVKDFNNALFMFIKRTVIKNKIQENLVDMLSKNKLGNGNKRLKGRDWTDYDVKSSREMLKKINETLRYREQPGRLEEYVGRRSKTVNPCTFVRHV